MKQYDVIVIGGGTAGLFAAITAAYRGKRVLVIAKGVGSIAIGGGTVDVLGYDGNGVPVRSPWDSLAELPANHPYTLVGRDTVATALHEFQTFCSQGGYSYIGNLTKNQWVPTALGTLKPSCLTPKTMDTAALKDAKEVVVVGFDGLKDYCTQVITQGLTAVSGGRTRYSSVSVNTGMEDGRDISALDVARWLDTENGRYSCVKQLAQLVVPESVLLLPPVLGTQPTYEVFTAMEQSTRCKIIETLGLPPAVIGFRLRKLLVNCMKKLNVQMIEQATVVRAAVTNGRCTEITTENIDRERNYRADSFILATGGLFGGGLQAGPGFVTEAVFNLPVQVPQQLNEWGNERLFFTTGQPFARFGVSVNDKMRPVDAAGKVVLENVYVAGQNLGGYDYCVEKSGNGVALATAYRAGLEA